MQTVASVFSFRCRLHRLAVHLPAAITVLVVVAMLAYGVIEQPAGYHDFADHSLLFGLPYAADVLSNAGFALVGAWGWWRLSRLRGEASLRAGWPGYRLFLVGLMLTAAGSAWYHLAPDDFRLLWDRLPIALACAGLLAAVRAETVARFDAATEAAVLALFAVASVAWWHFTLLAGAGDLRPYLLLQLLPIVLIPLWQWLYRVPRRDRLYFGLALAVYVVAKAAELNDHAFLAMSGVLSGHTLKHLLATLAAGLIVWRLVQRTSEGEVLSPSSSRRRMPASSTSSEPPR